MAKLSFFSRLFYRTSSRIAAIYFTAIFLTALTVVFTLMSILPEHPRNQFSEKLAAYAIKQLGETKNHSVLNDFSEKLGASLLVLGPQGAIFQTRKNFPPESELRHFFNAKNALNSYGFQADDGNDYFLLRHGENIYVFSDFKLQFSNYGRMVLTTAAVAIILILLFSFLAIRRAIMPLTPLHETVQKIGKGNLSARTTLKRRDEIGTLSEQINTMATALEETQRSKREFMVAIGHEFSSPIARMMFQLENINDDKLRDKIQKNLLQINELFRRLVSIETLRDPTVLNKNTAYDFTSLFSEMLTEFSDDPVELDLQNHTGKIFINRMRLNLLLSNLVSNALRYAPDSIVKVVVRHHDQQLEIKVQDRGPGVSDEFLQKITEPFSRQDPARSGQTGGLGLGLYLCAQIVERDQGQLAFRNRDGGGFEVTVMLPCTFIP